MLKVNLWWLKQPCDIRSIHFDYTIELNKEEQASRMTVLFREVFNHPYISLFHLLVNGFSVTCVYKCSVDI